MGATPEAGSIHLNARRALEHGGTLPKDAGHRVTLTRDSTVVCDLDNDYQYGQVTSGAWRLAGTLEIRFSGPCEPHEAAVFTLFGPGVQSLEGRFDKVVVPVGWLYDLDYDPAAKTVTLRNLRPNRAPAFPGAEGFGKYAIGGRGGKLFEVTNLNDSGPGSLRKAVGAEGPRIVVFRISGTIPLKSPLKIKNPFITIAGQSAPGDGICLKGYPLSVEAPHTIVRYIHSRPGDVEHREMDGLGGGRPARYVIVDHCSASWSTDETLSFVNIPNMTLQWCLSAESLSKSVHHKGPHGYGGIWAGAYGVSCHHNILAHHTSRNPRIRGHETPGLVDVRNNVIYNWGFQSAYGGELHSINWVNNYYKSGPATKENVKRRIFDVGSSNTRIFLAGNRVLGYPEISADNWAGGIDYGKKETTAGPVPSQTTCRVDTPFLVAPVVTHTADAAYELVLQSAGCSLQRDPLDTRIIEEIRTGTAHYGATWNGGGKGIIDSQADVGGWPVLRSLPAPADADHDGMPDAWEIAHGLNSTNAADGIQDRDGDGYTNVEEYLNSLAPAGSGSVTVKK
jgi:pectate lyase